MQSLGKIVQYAALLAALIIGPASNAIAAGEKPAFIPRKTTTALLITDPQNDFMDQNGAAWGLVGENVTRLGTNGNIARLIRSAKDGDMPAWNSVLEDIR